MPSGVPAELRQLCWPCACNLWCYPCVLQVASEKHLLAAADLLGVDAEGLSKALTTRTRQTVDGASGSGSAQLLRMHACVQRPDARSLVSVCTWRGTVAA